MPNCARWTTPGHASEGRNFVRAVLALPASLPAGFAEVDGQGVHHVIVVVTVVAVVVGRRRGFDEEGCRGNVLEHQLEFLLLLLLLLLLLSFCCCNFRCRR